MNRLFGNWRKTGPSAHSSGKYMKYRIGGRNECEKLREEALEIWPAVQKAAERFREGRETPGMALRTIAEDATLPGEEPENMSGRFLRGLATDMYPPAGYGAVPEDTLDGFNSHRRRMNNLVNRLAEQLEDVATFDQLRKRLQKNLSNHQANLTVLWYLGAATDAQSGAHGMGYRYRSWQVLSNALTPSIPDTEVLPRPRAEA